MRSAYGQRHTAELEAAARVAKVLGAVDHRVMDVDLGAFGGSALTDPAIPVPESPVEGVPVTYVPARNTVFLSFALAWSEVLGAHDIFIGVNAIDYSGYRTAVRSTLPPSSAWRTWRRVPGPKGSSRSLSARR